MEGPSMNVSSATLFLNQMMGGSHVAKPNKYSPNCRANVRWPRTRAHAEPRAIGSRHTLRVLNALAVIDLVMVVVVVHLKLQHPAAE